jgi:NAD(P)H-dependent FMN reductase
MLDTRSLSIPVILGTPRQGRLSEYVAGVVVEELCKREGMQTTLIDVRELPLATTDAGEGIKDRQFSDAVMGADGQVIVAPEYNHGYPGILKHALDTNLSGTSTSRLACAASRPVGSAVRALWKACCQSCAS